MGGRVQELLKDRRASSWEAPKAMSATNSADRARPARGSKTLMPTGTVKDDRPRAVA